MKDIPFLYFFLGAIVADELYYYSIGNLISKYLEGKHTISKDKAYYYALEHKTMGNMVIYIMFSSICKQWIGFLYSNISEYGIYYIPFSIISYFLLSDFLFFCFHRLCHTSLLYNTIHKYHHKFNPTTLWAVRASHWLDSNIENLAFTIPLMIIPIYTPILLIILIFTYTWSMLLHSDIQIKLHNSYVNDNRSHYIHHLYGKHNYNYAFFFSHMDKLMGTYKYY